MVNIQLIKVVARLLILLILFVILFLISAVLYSARYWPDIYNYVHANITITRIPTLAELNTVDYEAITDLTSGDYESTTEYYSTTDLMFYADVDEDFLPYYNDRRFLNKTVFVDGFFDYEEAKIDGANKGDVLSSGGGVVREIFNGENLTNSTSNGNCHFGANGSVAAAIFPPIAAIFAKSGSGNQFEYVCDGAILSTKKILTAARCVLTGNRTRDSDDIIVIAGKRSLADMTDNQALRVKQIKLHVNFTTSENRVENDLAAIYLEGEITFNDRIQTACLYDDVEENITDASTSGWQLSGELLPIKLLNNQNACVENLPEVFCDSYGLDVAVCPSHGGLYFVKLQNHLWYLKGLLTEDTSNRGICDDRTLKYTDITKYMDWIQSL